MMISCKKYKILDPESLIISCGISIEVGSEMENSKLRNTLLVVFFSFIVNCNAQDDAIFVVSGPKVIVQEKPYTFTAIAQRLITSLSVDYKLSGTDVNGVYNELNLNMQRIFSDEQRKYTFDTQSLKDGKYQLSVVAYDSFMKATYKDVQTLIFRKTLVSAFINTDKPIYKAGDMVVFKIFGTDSETRPWNFENAIVSIYSPDDTKIKVFTNITFVRGKYEASFKLSDISSLGIYRINFVADKKTVDKTFEVQDYVLPTFSVRVTVPTSAALTDQSIPVTITAEYTFGKPVQGVAIVKFSKSSWARWGFGYVQVYERTVTITTGSETFDVNFINDLQLENVDGQTIDIQVEFTEKLTKKVIETSASLTVSQFPYEGVITGENTFVQNSIYTCTLSLRSSDGKPAPAGTKVTVTYILSNYCTYDRKTFRSICPSTQTTQVVILDATGSAILQVSTGSADNISIQSKSAVSAVSYFYISKLQKSTNTLDLELITTKPEIGSQVLIKISTSSVTLRRCFCIMISKGLMVNSQAVSIANQTATLMFTPTFLYAPTTEVICFISNVDGDIQSARLTVSLTTKLPNFLDLSLSSKTVKPGTNLSLKVSTYINSVVSLNAIDQSVLLLKSGHEFTIDDVFNDFYQYNANENIDWNSPSDEYNFEYMNCFVIKKIVRTSNIIRTTTTTQTPIRRRLPIPIIMAAAPNMAIAEAPAMAMAAEAVDAPMMMAKATGGVADVAAQAPAATAPPRLRTAFLETIPLADVIADKPRNFGSVYSDNIVEFKAPDSITSYIFSGVSMNEKYGIGIQSEKPALKVFLPFFILISLPNNIKRGEILMQDFIIFNYLTASQTVTISVKRNDQQFEVLDPAFDKWQVLSDSYTQTFVSVPNQPTSFRIVIRALVLGFIDIKIDAIGPLAGDSLLKPLRIVPEGVPKLITQSILLSKNDTSTTVSTSLSCSLPPTAVNDTTSAWATCVGDLMGDMINNLENLIQMSYGCGEQNMLNFVPNIVVLIYLTKTGKITATLKSKAISYAEDGYQRELTYRRSDGSFSAFGNSDTSGSTWLTAYVIKSFIWAQDYINIDSKVISDALSYLMSKQNSDGSFREDGRVIHKDMQGGSSAGLAMTAYVSIVLSDNLGKYPEHTSARDKALAYIVANLDYNDVYALAISSYALYLGNHASFNSVYAKLLLKGIETSDQLRWEKPVANTQDQNCWWWYTQPRSNDVEITAYALQLIANIDLAKGAKIMKYLVSQKNAYGGYGSSQDTVVGITALASFSVLFNVFKGTLNIHLTPNRGSAFDVTVNSANQMTLQTFDLDPLTRKLDVLSGVGSSGSALVSFTCKFYEVTKETSPRFEISHTFIHPCKEALRSRVCLNYISRPDDTESNMVLVTITLLSGYTYDIDNKLPSFIRSTEVQDEKTKIDFYLDSLTAEVQCFDIPSNRENIVEELKSGTIEVRDYYNTAAKAQILYSAPKNIGSCSDLPEEKTTTTTRIVKTVSPILIDDPIPIVRPIPVKMAVAQNVAVAEAVA